jgi:DNA-binding beta-propeller fold protein YncE
MLENKRPQTFSFLLTTSLALFAPCLAGYVNFESSHVHPLDLTPSGARLLAVNTPDARLEVFEVQPDGSLVHAAAIPVGLEPVSVVGRTDDEAWVVNHLSQTVSIVDLGLGVTVRTLFVGDEPTDVAFTQNRAFVAVSAEDRMTSWRGTR